MAFKTQAYKDHCIRQQRIVINEKKSNVKRAQTNHDRGTHQFTKGALDRAILNLDYAIEYLNTLRSAPVTGK
jgi:hypothetical protein